MASVLFVDDDPSILNALRREFRSFPSHTFFASSAQEGLDMLEQHQIGVVVSDNDMPDMKGVEFLSLVRSRDPDVCRIVLTGAADLSVAIAAINRCGASRFITKPWSSSELRQVVEESIEEFRALRAMRSGKEGVYRALAHTVELKDPYTKGHCDRVADYALQLAHGIGLQEPMLSHIRHGCILHDCGKIAVPGIVLNKPGSLNEEEFEQIKHHPVKGGEVARQAELPQEVVNIILYHHERYSGGGYPEGLSGEEIPLEARIVAIADVYDALASSRPYREGMPHESVLNVMQTMAASHFDPHLLRQFMQCIREAAPPVNF